MYKNRQISCFVLAIFLFTIALGTAVPQASAACQDISGHWAQSQIEFMIEQKIISGYGDNNFRPENPSSRAEFMVMTNKTFRFIGSTPIDFNDVKSSDWFAADIAHAVAAGYITGYGDKTIRPKQQISRQEVAVIIAEILSLKPANTSLTLTKFSDSKDIGNWSQDAVAAVVERGYMNGYPDKSFKPASSIKRAEVATILRNVYGKRPENIYSEPPQPGKLQSKFDKAGSYGPDSGVQNINEDVVISSRDVILKNTDISGDLTITAAVGNGDVALKNVEVEGTAYIYGGGENSITIEQCELNKVVVNKTDGKIRVVLSKDSSIKNLVVDSGLKLTGSGRISDLTINSSGVEIEPEPLNTPFIKSGISAKIGGKTVTGTSSSSGGGGGGGSGSSTVTTASVSSAADFNTALANSNITTINLTGSFNSSPAITRSLTINFGANTITGNVTFSHSGTGTSVLTGNAGSRIIGNLTVDTANASFHNGVAVSGTVTIDNVAPGSWTESANGNTIIITDPNGATISIIGSPGSVTVSAGAGAGGVLTITVNPSASLSELNINAANVSVVGANRIDCLNSTQTVTLDGTPQAAGIYYRIDTSSTIANAAVNPTVTVTGTNFKAGIATSDLTAGTGTTGLTFSGVTRLSESQITLAFTGTATGGNITIQAKTSAFDPAGTEASNTLTVTVPTVAGSVALSSATYSVAENGGPVTITVNRSGGSDGAASVQYATSNNTATAGSDYTTASGTLNWADEEDGAKTFTVSITDDAAVEGNETFTVTLSNASGASLGAPSTATVTITDNDVAPAGSVALSSATYSVAENGGPVTITVNRSGGSDGAASVQYATSSNTATADIDYTTASGTLNWADGDAAAKTFTVSIIDDAAVEGDEFFTVTLSNATGASLGAQNSAPVTITENDVFTPGSVALSSATYSVAENGVTVTITVNRSGGSSGGARVMYATSNGTATAGSDYTAANGNLVWADGEAAAKTFTVSITDDAAVEGNETFTITLSNADGASLGAPSTATVTITDNDAALFLSHNVAGNAKTFTPVTAGYGSGTQEAALTVTVTSTGANNNVVAALSGTNPGSFDLVEAIGNLTDGQTGTFTVRPKDALAQGTHTATVTITSDEFATGTTFTVTQVVNAASSLSHNVAGNAKTFTPVTAGYGSGTQEAALTVTVTSTGANNNVVAALSGTNPGSFDLVEAIGNLTDGQSGTFTVGPKDALAQGTHTATVTITSDEFASGTTFTVTQVVNAGKSLSWAAGAFTETTANEGIIGNSKTVTLSGDTFTNDGSFNAGDEYTVANVPAGLTPSINRDSDTQLTISLTGNATAHKAANNISNLGISFQNAAFTGGDAASATDASKNNLSIEYFNPAWTIMVYSDADNNLEGSLLNDIAEMKTGVSNEVNLVVLVDRKSGGDGDSSDSSVLGENFTDTRLYEITSGTATRIAGGTQFTDITASGASAEYNMGDANTLEKFIEFCKANYTANHYALILSNHGGGARSREETPPSHNNSEKAVCWDDTDSDDCLYTAEISDVLDAADSVDLLGFDACFMGTAEVAYQYRSGNGSFAAASMVASAPTEWGNGWDYAAFLARLQAGGGDNGTTDSTMGNNEQYYDPATMSDLQLGGVIVEEQHDSCEAVSETTQSLACFDLSKAGTVKTAVDALAVQVVNDSAMNYLEEIRGSLNLTVTMEYFNQDDREDWRDYPYFDLYDLCNRVNSSANFTAAAKTTASNVMTAVADMVLCSYGGSGYTDFTNGQNGLSIFFTDGAIVVTDNPDPNQDDYLWDYQWWYNSIDTATTFSDPAMLYGKLKWCQDGAIAGNNTVENWFEILDFLYESLNASYSNGYEY